MLSNKKITINADEYKQEVNLETIANKLEELLNENKISTKVLSEATGISIAGLNNLKRGEGNPTLGTLNAICKFFGIKLIDLLGLDNLSNIQIQSMIVPLYDLRFANQRSEETILSRTLIETPKNCVPNLLFGVVINNNSLSPLYEKGTIFILSEKHDAMDGDIVLLRIQKNNNSLKRLFIRKNKYFVKNLNLDDSIETYSKSDLEILGIVIQIIQKPV